MSLDLTDPQLRILRHMLGIDDRCQKHPECARDYYCANPGDAELVALERAGAVNRYRFSESYWWYATTPAGRTAAIKSFYARRASRDERRYLSYLSARDCFSGLTFKQFLTQPRFAETRRDA